MISLRSRSESDFGISLGYTGCPFYTDAYRRRPELKGAFPSRVSDLPPRPASRASPSRRDPNSSWRPLTRRLEQGSSAGCPIDRSRATVSEKRAWPIRNGDDVPGVPLVLIWFCPPRGMYALPVRGILIRVGVDQAFGGWNAPVD